MTDRPERPSTITPPPNRERSTDRPVATDRAPPEDLLQLSENVFTRLGNVEDTVKRVEAAITEKFGKLDELYALLVGAAAHAGKKPRPNIITALHDLTGKVGVAGTNAELVADQQKTLPQLIAQELASKFIAIYQEEIRGLHVADNSALDRIKRLEERIDELAEPGPNGRGNHT